MKNNEQRLLDLINEERGISNIVVQWSNIVINVLQTKIRLSKPIPINRDYITFKKGEVVIDLTKIKLPVKWFYYNFIDNQTFEKNRDLLFREPNGINKYGLSITIYSINGNIDRDSFENTIGHELLHLFQAKEANKVFSNTELYKDENNWKNSDNKYLKMFGNILYLSNKFEQDAYNHGLYTSMLQCKWHDELMQVLKNDQIYYIIDYISDCLEKLETVNKDDTELNTALDTIAKYGYTFNKVTKLAKNSIERFNRLLARTYDKAERDWKKQHMISEFYDFKHQLTDDKEKMTKLENIMNEIFFKISP